MPRITSQEQQALYNEVKKEVKRANQRLVRLERLTGSTSTWAASKLMNRLDTEKLQAWTASNRIRLNEGMTVDQLRRIQSATRQFLESATSTQRGIKKAKLAAQASLGKTLELTDEEAEKLYLLFSEDYIGYLTKYVPASALMALIEYSKEKNHTEQQFINLIEEYKTVGNDMDLAAVVSRVYDKYVAE